MFIISLVTFSTNYSLLKRYFHTVLYGAKLIIYYLLTLINVTLGIKNALSIAKKLHGKMFLTVLNGDLERTATAGHHVLSLKDGKAI